GGGPPTDGVRAGLAGRSERTGGTARSTAQTARPVLPGPDQRRPVLRRGATPRRSDRVRTQRGSDRTGRRGPGRRTRPALRPPRPGAHRATDRLGVGVSDVRGTPGARRGTGRVR